MFGFGKKKGPVEMNLAAAEAFWKWFATEQKGIEEAVNYFDDEDYSDSDALESAMDELNATSDRLLKCFPYVKKIKTESEKITAGTKKFRYVVRYGKDEDLKRDAEKVGQMMPEKIAETWEWEVRVK